VIIEMRVYRCAPGRMPALQERFAKHTLAFFKKHGIEPLGFWTTLVGSSNHELTYLLKWKDMAEREAKWNAFQSDPDWIARRAESEAEKPIVANIECQFLAPAAFFPAGIGASKV
jgi:NIPSNAP